MAVQALGLGYLDPTNDDHSLAQDDKIDMPFWMAQSLAKRGLVSVQTPRAYSQTFLANIHAHPQVVNLNRQSPYYYRLGAKLSKMYCGCALSKC